MGTAERRQLGADGEAMAAAWYQAAGYTVLARNWRCRDGELDLVCEAGDTVVFCEVKARRSSAFGTPADAVTPTKQRRVRRLAGRWLATHPHADHRRVRFDVAAVTAGRLSVIVDAF